MFKGVRGPVPGRPGTVPKQVEAELTDTPKSDANDVKAQIKTLSNDVAELTGLMQKLVGTTASGLFDAAETKAHQTAERAGDLADRAEALARAEVGSLERHISEKPLQSALIALLIGLVFGAMSRR